MLKSLFLTAVIALVGFSASKALAEDREFKPTEEYICRECDENLFGYDCRSQALRIGKEGQGGRRSFELSSAKGLAGSLVGTCHLAYGALNCRSQDGEKVRAVINSQDFEVVRSAMYRSEHYNGRLYLKLFGHHGRERKIRCTLH